MIRKSLLLAAALAGVSLTTATFAYSPEAAPAPRVIMSSVVSPTGLPRAFEGKVVTVAFRLDAEGQPRDIEVLWVRDAVLEKQLVQAFRQWRFEKQPANAGAAPQRYILPIELKPEV
jgi:TonB family protein